jgi:hypothetical protein
MDVRKLRMVKPPLPAIGICEACNSQFTSNERSQEEAEKQIKAAFDSHECTRNDASLNAPARVSGYTEKT